MTQQNFARRIALVALMLSLGWTAATVQAHGPQSSDLPRQATARYLANEGVLIELDDTKVLFDAFFSNSYNNYSLVPDTKVLALQAGTAPYEGIDALFISHAHGDHFSPEPTLAYLRAQSGVHLFGPIEAVDALKALIPEGDSLAKRLTAFTLNPNDPPQNLSIGDIDIDVVAIPHAGGKRMEGVRNLVFRVTLNEALTVVHMGDAAPEIPLFEAQQRHWNYRTTDHAFPPYWFFEAPDGEHILENNIGALNTTGVHVPAKATGKGDEWRERLGADLFTDPGEERTLPVRTQHQHQYQHQAHTVEPIVNGATQ